MDVLFRAIDLETAGKAPPHSVLEIGWTDFLFNTETKKSAIGATNTMLFKPREKLTADNIAVHHMTAAYLADWPHCEDHDLVAAAQCEMPAFLVAAKAEFEQQWFTPEISGTAKWLCTVKIAARLFPEAPSHSNQAMRYELGLDLPDERAMPPHRAGPDSYVTACIMARFLEMERVQTMELWTRQPRYLHTCPLHKHKGQLWSEVPKSYLEWILRADSTDEDVRHAAILELDRRRGIAQ